MLPFKLIFLILVPACTAHLKPLSYLRLVEFGIEASLSPIHIVQDGLRKRNAELEAIKTIFQNYLDLFEKLAGGEPIQGEKGHLARVEQKDAPFLVKMLGILCQSPGKPEIIYNEISRMFVRNVEDEKWTEEELKNVGKEQKLILANLEGITEKMGSMRVGEARKCVAIYAQHYGFLYKMAWSAKMGALGEAYLPEFNFVLGWLEPMLDKLYASLADPLHCLHAVDYAIQASLLTMEEREKAEMREMLVETSLDEYIAQGQMEGRPPFLEGHLKGWTGPNLVGHIEKECKGENNARKLFAEFKEQFLGGMRHPENLDEKNEMPMEWILGRMEKGMAEINAGKGEEWKKCRQMYGMLYGILGKIVQKVGEEKGRNGYWGQQGKFLNSWMGPILEKLNEN